MTTLSNTTVLMMVSLIDLCVGEYTGPGRKDSNTKTGNQRGKKRRRRLRGMRHDMFMFHDMFVYRYMSELRRVRGTENASSTTQDPQCFKIFTSEEIRVSDTLDTLALNDTPH